MNRLWRNLINLHMYWTSNNTSEMFMAIDAFKAYERQCYSLRQVTMEQFDESFVGYVESLARVVARMANYVQVQEQTQFGPFPFEMIPFLNGERLSQLMQDLQVAFTSFTDESGCFFPSAQGSIMSMCYFGLGSFASKLQKCADYLRDTHGIKVFCEEFDVFAVDSHCLLSRLGKTIAPGEVAMVFGVSRSKRRVYFFKNLVCMLKYLKEELHDE